MRKRCSISLRAPFDLDGTARALLYAVPGRRSAVRAPRPRRSVARSSSELYRDDMASRRKARDVGRAVGRSRCNGRRHGGACDTARYVLDPIKKIIAHRADGARVGNLRRGTAGRRLTTDIQDCAISLKLAGSVETFRLAEKDL